VKTLHS